MDGIAGWCILRLGCGGHPYRTGGEYLYFLKCSFFSPRNPICSLTLRSVCGTCLGRPSRLGEVVVESSLTLRMRFAFVWGVVRCPFRGLFPISVTTAAYWQ